MQASSGGWRDDDAGQAAASVRLACGRRFSYREYGEPGGRPVFALHGTPGSHCKFDGGAAAAAREHGIRLVAPDRWSYGLSDAPEAPSLAVFAADIAEIADQLGIGRFGIVGISGGGPYAAAVAAGLGRRLTAAALVSPVGPIAGVVPPPRLGAYHHLAFRVMPKLPGVVSGAFTLLGAIARRAPRFATRITAGRAPHADRVMARDDEFATALGRAFAAGLANNANGPMIDMRIFHRPWGMDLAAVTAPTRVWIGDQDRNVPLAAVETLIAALSAGTQPLTVTRLPGHGHFWIARNFTEVLEWLAAQPD
jgi:pimeloyl-ACP methyl ester carboxylesterase